MCAEAAKSQDSELLEIQERKRQTLIKRLIVAIVLLIKENPILPFSFKFKEKCILTSLKEERETFKKMNL